MVCLIQLPNPGKLTSTFIYVFSVVLTLNVLKKHKFLSFLPKSYNYKLNIITTSLKLDKHNWSSVILLYCGRLDNVNELRLIKEILHKTISNQVEGNPNMQLRQRNREKHQPSGKLRRPKTHPSLVVLPILCSLLHSQNLKMAWC